MVLLLALIGCTDEGAAGPGSSAAAAPETRDCTPSGVELTPDVRYRQHTGSDPDLTSLDVHRPVLAEGCPPTPVLVWVHGGGWQVGDRRRQVADKVDLLTSDGWTVVSTNYRLSPEVRYPTHNDDVAAAVGWVLDHSGELGLDPQRLTVMGHSAGAGIVAAVATDPRHLALVDRAPRDPAVWAEASPMNHLDAATSTARSLVVTRGSNARQGTAERFVEGLRQVGVEAELLDVSPLDHATVNRAVGQYGDRRVTPGIVDFLDGC